LDLICLRDFGESVISNNLQNKEQRQCDSW